MQSPPKPRTDTNNNGGGASSRGQIHVKLIQARGLHVRNAQARPYVVVQFEQNEFVSRDPTGEADKEVKGTPTQLQTSSAMSALGAITTKAAANRKSPNTSPASSLPSSSTSNGLFGRLSAHNPVWKHEVSLCVFFV